MNFVVSVVTPENTRLESLVAVSSSELKSQEEKPKYDSVVFLNSLMDLWELMGRINSKKMKAAIPLWLPFYKQLSPDIKFLLLSVSAADMSLTLGIVVLTGVIAAFMVAQSKGDSGEPKLSDYAPGESYNDYARKAYQRTYLYRSPTCK